MGKPRRFLRGEVLHFAFAADKQDASCGIKFPSYGGTVRSAGAVQGLGG